MGEVIGLRVRSDERNKRPDPEAGKQLNRESGPRTGGDNRSDHGHKLMGVGGLG